MTKTYNKLVRDRIPEIIEATGQSCVTRVLSDADYIRMLDEKLNEELAEYQESKSTEELADLLEVIEATALARGCSWEELLSIKAQKRQKRGGFEEKILLLEVTDDP
jgi:predicted house-cleaning noncanonical NTP pyrophosphatase (MazG superfamily)